MSYPICIIAANRFSYFKQVIDSLAPQIEKRPFVLFLDREINGNVHEEHIEYVKSKKIYNYQCIVRNEHYGCGKNLIDARRWMFEHFGDAKAIHVFEDDMVPSHTYIHKNEQLFDYQTNRHFNVGSTQLWKICFLTREEKEQRKSELAATFDSLLGYLISRRCWNDISPFLYEYERQFLNRNIDYRLRPHNEIWNWLISQHVMQPRFRYPLSYILNKDEEIERQTYMRRFITGQDGVTIHSLHIMGWVRLSPIVNYGKYVGEYGVHHSPSLFKEQGYDKIEMFED